VKKIRTSRLGRKKGVLIKKKECIDNSYVFGCLEQKVKRKKERVEG